MREKILLFLLCFASLGMFGCGVDTRDWPVVKLPFDATSIERIKMEYEDNELNEEKNIFEESIIKYICLNIAYPYQEKTEDINVVEGWYQKLSFSFFLKESDELPYNLSFFNRGISNGYICINYDEVHFIPGDISSLYESIVEKLWGD